MKTKQISEKNKCNKHTQKITYIFCDNITTFRILKKIHKSVVFGGDGIPKSYNLNYCHTIVYQFKKRQLERNLSLIAAFPNDGCYSKQGTTSYVYLQTFCVCQILRMRYWVMMPNEACIRNVGSLSSK